MLKSSDNLARGRNAIIGERENFPKTRRSSRIFRQGRTNADLTAVPRLGMYRRQR